MRLPNNGTSEAYRLLWAAGIRGGRALEFADVCSIREWYDAVLADDLADVLIAIGVEYWPLVNVVIQPCADVPDLLCDLCRYDNAGDVFNTFQRRTNIDPGPALRESYPYDLFLEKLLCRVL